MCGVFYYFVVVYIEQLIKKGYKVVICEQMEDLKVVKGVVKREVVQLIILGIVMDGKGIYELENNFIVFVFVFFGGYGFVLLDLMIGENFVVFIEWIEDVMLEIYLVGVKEIVVLSKFNENIVVQLKEWCGVMIFIEDGKMIDWIEIVKYLFGEELIEMFMCLYMYLQKM